LNAVTALAAALLAALVAACEPQAPVDIALGSVLPTLQVRTVDGAAAELQSAPDKVMVLNVWAVWCHPCREEMPSLERLSQRLDPERVAVVGLSVDQDGYLVDEFLRRYGVSFPVYLDTPQRAAQRRLGVTVLPETFLVGADGRVRARITGQRDWERPEVQELLEQLQREGSVSQDRVSRVLGQ